MRALASRPRRKRSLLRCAAIGATALVAMGGPGSGGCAAPFDPPSTLNALRILAVTADTPYGTAGEDITLKMTVVDGRDTDNFTPVTIIWLGGCYNPDGGQYYNCYTQLAELFAGLGSGQLPPDGLIGTGDTFELPIPEDIITSQADPELGPKYGLAYVFFMACAGEVKPVIQDGDTSAGFFPLGCFGSDGESLGPDAFVPGYTQVYVFEDERENPNPPVDGLEFDGEIHEEGSLVDVELCSVTLEERRKSGCAATDEFTECDVYDVDVVVPDDVADEDVESKDAEGNTLREVVWVSYFATGGTFESETKLISDAVEGIQSDRGVRWVPPEEPGFYQIWAVVRDNRGGSRVLSQNINVSE